MLWAVLAISAALIWAVVNIIDKFVVSKLVKNPLVPLIFLGIAYLSLTNILLALFVGVFYMITSMFYFKALSIEEASRINPLFFVSSIYILFLAAIFLGEKLSLSNYIGVFLLVGGAVLISLKSITNIGLGRAFWYMMLADIFLAVSSILTKYLLGFTDYWTIFSYSRLGCLIILVPILFYTFSDLVESVKKNGVKLVSLVSTNEILNVFAVLLLVAATSLGSVTLVSAFTALQPFFVLSIAVFLSIFFPHIIKEVVTKRIILIKLVAILILFVGATLAVL